MTARLVRHVQKRVWHGACGAISVDAQGKYQEATCQEPLRAIENLTPYDACVAPVDQMLRALQMSVGRCVGIRICST